MTPDRLSITFIGHSTVLLQSRGVAIATDPNYDAAFGPFVPRREAPGINIADLPRLAMVLISHDHFDHLSRPTLRALPGGYRLVIPKGTRHLFQGLNKGAQHELAHGQAYQDWQVKVTALPAVHVSKRLLLGRSRPANNYLIELHGKTIFFAGDTGYGPQFREIGAAWDIDAALLPVGLATPDFLFGKTHLNPEKALRAFMDLRARIMIPIHYGTFRTVLEKPDYPLSELRKQITRYDLGDKVKIMRPGESIHL
ncbi:MBL fold metallo-hydrolase [Geotalea toluenoxydans]|uniref:MBL fold metallo-hydrolase n=1 Tax=Geotalea toluenoxydans TaxID=421624 RepID=UPI0006D2337B|nr:MBL fold metallo-hydrolase [Geotalea toluenoxydans]